MNPAKESKMSSFKTGFFLSLLAVSLLLTALACNNSNPPVTPGSQLVVNTPCTACTSTPTPTPTGTTPFTFTPTITPTGTQTPTPTITGTSTNTPTITRTPCASVMGQTFGTSTGYYYGSQIVTSLYPLSSAATIQDLWVPINSTSGGLISAAIYGDSGLGYPGSLIVQSQPQTLVTGLIRFPLPNTPLPAGNYWLAIQMYNYGYTYLYYNSTGLPSDKYCYYYQSFGNFPLPGTAWNRSSGALFNISADSCYLPPPPTPTCVAASGSLTAPATTGSVLGITDYLSAWQVTVPGYVRLSDFKLNDYCTPNTSALYVGIYADSGGSPSTLVAAVTTTGASNGSCAPGVRTLPLGSPTYLPPGNYWLAVVGGPSAEIYLAGSSSSGVYGYSSSGFSSLPSTFPYAYSYYSPALSADWVCP